jgi:hypothetical protein
MRVTDAAETGLGRRIGTIGTFDASGAGDEEGKADAGSDPIAARDSTSGGAAVADARQLTAHTPAISAATGIPTSAARPIAETRRARWYAAKGLELLG